MVVSKAIRATGCASCRLSLLKNLISLPIRTVPATGRFHATKLARQQTRFSSHIRPSEQEEASKHEVYFENKEFLDEDKAGREEVKNEVSQFEDFPEDRDLLDESNAIGEDVENSVTSVPWYLQVEAPQLTPRTLSERQIIPDLPESPPPILQPMLQQLSVDLGLDDLTLLDLRKLDPPPALGANLIMLIGTARSEKHLHVSADRLCRWLRSTYKLRPSADGLLGRNELKLKLRRKSRRAKLLGSAADDNGDDGIRTGWVCVDIGVVESPDMHANAIPEGDGFVGFGRRTDGVRVVVQMLTDEKRQEIDLEKLWGGILRRSGQSEVEDKEVVEDVEVGEPISTMNPQPSQHTSKTTLKSRGFQVPQIRQFHTVVARKSDTAMDQHSDGILSSPQRDGQIENSRLTELQRSVLAHFSYGEFGKATNDVLEYSAHDSELDWQNFLLHHLRMYLENVSVEQAMLDLGSGYTPGDTSFLKCFKYAVADIGEPHHHTSFKWDYVFWLFHYAQDIGHPGFEAMKLIKLFKIFKSKKFDDGDIADEYYHKIIRTILEPVRGPSGTGYAPSHLKVRLALMVIQTMYRRGHKILTEDMFVTLQEATERTSELDVLTVQPKATINDSLGLPTKAMTPIQRRIHALMVNLDLPPFSDVSRMRLMQLYARNGYWVAFWDIWRLPLRQSKPQSFDMYTYMFQRVAETGHQEGCMKTLRTWIGDLDREDSLVKLEGEIAEAVKACLMVAHADIEQEAIENPERPGEWFSLWRRCHGGDEQWRNLVEAMVAEHEQGAAESDDAELNENAAMMTDQEFDQVYDDEYDETLATAGRG
ncbi:a013af18-e5d9-4139-8e95-33b744c67273 [Sclerotinia trifoliorum]|uniref:ATPase synthesis protein 25 n=1 Tax=Sclerotinia trifoliorum TaxID=28548 RepID=A0A8H2W2U1_9HELO|nr:a013af18-e5d9-4139-8e95-33b744c67273 [Sclerotinia trifoliorum]